MPEVDSCKALVSIVIPTYNRAWGLRLSIESALSQTYPHVEVVVVDDHCQDNTAEVVASFKDPRIVYFRQPKNVGMVSNWGHGLHMAEGEFVVFLADDDQLFPNYVANRLNRIFTDEDVQVVFSRYTIQNQDGGYIRTQNEDFGAERKLESLDLLRCALERRWFIGASLYRKKAVEALWDKIKDDDLVLDFGLNIRLSFSSQGVYISENDFVMLSHAGQNSQAKRLRVYQQTFEALERIIAEDPQHPGVKFLKQEIAQCHVGWGRYAASTGRISNARFHFAKALRIAPLLRVAWLNLVVACLLPKRLMLKAQREFASA